MIAPINRILPAAGRLKRTPSFCAPVLRVCMVSDDFLPAATGVGIHIQTVSAELARRGHDVSIITTRRPGQPEREVWKGVCVYRMFSLKVCGFWQALPRTATLRAIFNEIRPEIVHYHYLGFLLKKARRIAAELGARNVYTYHMTAEHLTQQLLMRPFRGLIARDIVKFCNGCDLILAPSQKLAERVPQDGIRVPVAYVSNPVEFAESGRNPAPIEKRGFTVLFAGRLAPEKNLPLLFKAFALFRARRPDAELLIAGEGGERGRLEKLAAQLGVGGAVSFLGYRDHAELAGCYAAADVFVLPSLIETQGLVAMEAMRFGVPLLVCDRIVSAGELVDDGVNGFLVDAERPEDLAGRLALLSRDPGLRAEMGRRGRLKSAAYSPQTVVDGLEGHYRSLAAAASAPVPWEVESYATACRGNGMQDGGW